MNGFEFVWSVLKKYGITGLLIIGLFYIIFIKPENAYLISSKTYRLIARIFGVLGKKAISTKMEGAILNASHKMTKDCPCIESFGLKIEWIKEKTKDDFTKDKQIIVRMNERDRWDKNMVYAVHAYAKRGFIPYARPYMSHELDTSINMALTKRILSICSDGSLREFYENIYSIYKKDPRMNCTPKVRQYDKL